MDISVIGQAISHQNRVDTLEKVNINLLKTANVQAEQQTTQLLESVAPDTKVSDGNKGKNINIAV